MSSTFPLTHAAVHDGVQRRLHTGIQIYVSIDGEVVLNTVLGDFGSRTPIDTDSIMLWRSAGKPVTAAAIINCIESGRLVLDSTVSEIISEFSGTSVGEATIRSLLTHTSGIPVVDTGWPTADWLETLRKIGSASGKQSATAAYQPQSTWFVLGEILKRLLPQHRSINSVLNSLIFQPGNMKDVWCGLPDEIIQDQNSRLPLLYERTSGQLSESSYSKDQWLQAPSPGGNLRGPVSELGRFYEILLNDGLVDSGRRLLSAESVSLMTDRHRTNLFDETLQHKVDFGLGLIINSNHYGASTVPYGFGPHCSVDSFGHGGAQCSIGFCDPQRRLVVAWAADAFCGEGQHQRRNRAINDAIYRDLGFAD